MPPDYVPDPPVTVHIPTVGVVHFPNSMSMDEISAASKKIHQQKNPPLDQRPIREIPVDPEKDELRPVLDSDWESAWKPEKRIPSDPEDVIVGKTDGRKTFPNPNHVKPLLDTESPAPKIPARLDSRLDDRSVVPGGPEAAQGLAERGAFREGWDSNPEDAAKTQKLLNDEPAWKEEDNNLRRENLRTISDSLGSSSAHVLSHAIDEYDKAPPAARPKLEKQIFQKIIDYRKYSKAMTGEDKEEIDKKIAGYSNRLAKKKLQ